MDPRICSLVLLHCIQIIFQPAHNLVQVARLSIGRNLSSDYGRYLYDEETMDPDLAGGSLARIEFDTIFLHDDLGL